MNIHSVKIEKHHLNTEEYASLYILCGPRAVKADQKCNVCKQKSKSGSIELPHNNH